MNQQNYRKNLCEIAARVIQGVLGVADCIEQTGQPNKAETLRVMALRLDEVVGELVSLEEE